MSEFDYLWQLEDGGKVPSPDNITLLLFSGYYKSNDL